MQATKLLLEVMQLCLIIQLISTVVIQTAHSDRIQTLASNHDVHALPRKLSVASRPGLSRPTDLGHTSPKVQYAPETPNAAKSSGIKSVGPIKTGNNNLKSMIVRQQPGRDYLVVVDCGSSGSRVQIFHWPHGAARSELADQMETLRDPTTNHPLGIRIRPGLSSVRDHPDGASDYLIPIMQWASQNLPPQEHGRTPVYILGTAGLRSLTIEEREQILEDVMRDLKVQFDFQNIMAAVISGSEEGFFSWMSINTLAGRLGQKFNQAQGLSFYLQQPRSKRYGLVEMGGVSAQIAFEVTPAVDQLVSQRLRHSPEALEAFKKLRLDINLSDDPQDPKETMSVFSVSSLGFGSDEARALAIDLLVREGVQQLRRFGLLPLFYQPNSTMVIDDPCLPRNAEYAVVRPITIMYSPSRTIDYTARPNDQTILVRLVGRGNFGQCRSLLDRLVNVAKREKTTCRQLDAHGICDTPLMGTNFIPWAQLQWIGLGDLYYSSQMVHSSGHFSGFVLVRETLQLCSKTLEEVTKDHPAGNQFERTRNMLACFKATWILTWLSRVLMMPIDGSVDFTTTGQVMQEDVDWKLGAVIAKTIGYKSVTSS